MYFTTVPLYLAISIFLGFNPSPLIIRIELSNVSITSSLTTSTAALSSPSHPSPSLPPPLQGRRLTELSLWARDALATNEERLARAERILVLAEQVFECSAVFLFVGFLCFAKVWIVCVCRQRTILVRFISGCRLRDW
jgi:hypothetical protein